MTPDEQVKLILRAWRAEETRAGGGLDPSSNTRLVMARVAVEALNPVCGVHHEHHPGVVCTGRDHEPGMHRNDELELSWTEGGATTHDQLGKILLVPDEFTEIPDQGKNTESGDPCPGCSGIDDVYPVVGDHDGVLVCPRCGGCWPIAEPPAMPADPVPARLMWEAITTAADALTAVVKSYRGPATKKAQRALTACDAALTAVGALTDPLETDDRCRYVKLPAEDGSRRGD